LNRWPRELIGEQYADEYPYMDIYPLRNCGENCITTSPGPCQYHSTSVEPLGTMELMGRNVSIPSNPNRVLEVVYGSNWMIPEDSKNIHGKTKVRCGVDRGSAVIYAMTRPLDIIEALIIPVVTGTICYLAITYGLKLKGFLVFFRRKEVSIGIVVAMATIFGSLLAKFLTYCLFYWNLSNRSISDHLKDPPTFETWYEPLITGIISGGILNVGFNCKVPLMIPLKVAIVCAICDVISRYIAIL
jgi:hypothetical protein